MLLVPFFVLPSWFTKESGSHQSMERENGVIFKRAIRVWWCSIRITTSEREVQLRSICRAGVVRHQWLNRVRGGDPSGEDGRHGPHHGDGVCIQCNVPLQAVNPKHKHWIYRDAVRGETRFCLDQSGVLCCCRVFFWGVISTNGSQQCQTNWSTFFFASCQV